MAAEGVKRIGELLQPLAYRKGPAKNYPIKIISDLETYS
jgi:hypothetical protein